MRVCTPLVHCSLNKFLVFSGPIDFTVIQDSTVQGTRRSADGLPLQVHVDFLVQGRMMRLDLKRNPKLASAKDSVYVIKKSESGIPVLVAERITETEVRNKVNSLI